MLDRFRSLVVGLSLIVVVALIGLYLFVQVGGGEDIFGDSEGSLPSVDFEQLVYNADDNGYLMCPPELCEEAVPDAPSPVFTVSESRLRQMFVAYADDNPTVDTFRFDLMANQFDFTERLPGQTFPAVMTVKIVRVDAYSSTAAIYSRQPVGSSSKSDHAERVSRWLQVIMNAAGQSVS